MLTFAAFTPHPPIIIPEIGKDNIKYANNTISAMEKLSESIEPCDIDTVIFISPHTVLNPESMTISYAPTAAGNFDHFDHSEISFEAKVDTELVEAIVKASKEESIPLQINDYDSVFSLDHSVLVPYYFLQHDLPSSCKIIVIGFSALSRIKHLAFGQAIAKSIKPTDQNIALIASGDMSHRILDPDSELIGKKFDQEVVSAIKNNRTAEIVKIEERLQEDAGECGYRSLLILLGALDGFNAIPELLSYEAPFGVGYMVANFHLNN